MPSQYKYPTERDLIIGLKNNENAAYRQLVEQYHRQVISTCHHFLHNADDAHDIGQEVFIEVFRSIHRFREESSLSTWLYRISINKSLNLIKKNKINVLFSTIGNIFAGSNPPVEAYDPEETTEYEFEYQQKVDLLNKAISQLPDNQQKAFILNKYNQLSYKEIAEIMDISLSSVESLIHRAKINLQRRLMKKIIHETK